PELPRAPIRLPWEASRAILLTSVACESLMSSTADWRVSSMLVPVSPSGTGNTLRRLSSSWFAASHPTLPSSACLNWVPSTVDRRFVARAIRRRRPLGALFPDALDVDVDLCDGNVDRPLDGELDRLLEVVRDLGDPDPVLDHDVHV